MTAPSERPLLNTIENLFPMGGMDAGEMAKVMVENRIVDIGVSSAYIMSAAQGRQDFVVAYLSAHRIGRDGQIREDRFSDEVVADYAMLDDLRYLRTRKLGLLNLGNIGNHDLVPGKISPLDVVRLPLARLKQAHFLVSPTTASLAQDHKEIVLPHGDKGWEIREGDGLLEELQRTLIEKGWRFKVMDYHEWEPSASFSPHV